MVPRFSRLALLGVAAHGAGCRAPDPPPALAGKRVAHASRMARPPAGEALPLEQPTTVPVATPDWIVDAPTIVPQATGIASLGMGESGVCGVRHDGRVICWGRDEDRDARPPTLVEGADGAEQADVGSAGACLTHRSGRVSCWDTRGGRPQPVGGIEGAVQTELASLYSACSRLRSGSVACWGIDTVPARVPGLDDAVDLSVGPKHSCAIRGNGTVVCWGSLGRGGCATSARTDSPDGFICTCDPDRTVPLKVRGVDDAVMLSVGNQESCVVRSGGRVVCWDSIVDTYETTEAKEFRVPSEVPGLTDVAAISVADMNTCVVRRSGRVACWGRFRTGTDTGAHTSLAPVEVIGIEDAVAVATETGKSCVLRRSGEVHCWGNNRNGSLGWPATD